MKPRPFAAGRPIRMVAMAAVLAAFHTSLVRGQDEADDAFLGALFRVQFDQHLNEKILLDKDPAAELTVERCTAALEELKPGSVNVFALGHEGWARFPSKIMPPHPALSKDTLAIWREACDRTKTPLYVYVSSLINYKQNHEHPEFARLFSNGGPADQRIDHNSAFVERLLIPFLKEVAERYRPDGVWLDGDFWSIFPSWNPASVSGFVRATGRQPPLDFGDPAFPTFWEYTLASHADYVRGVADAIRSVKPDCGLVVNSGYTLRQPSPPPPFIARINLDAPTYYGLEVACLESRYQASRAGLPFDIVIGSHTEPEGSQYGYPKPPPQLAQEMATILANGGGLSVYVPVGVNGGFQLDELKRLRGSLSDFCLPRRAALAPSRSAAEVAVIHCAANFAESHALNDVRGAALALLRSNVAFDIVDDAAFVAAPGRYAAVVLPVDRRLPGALVEALDRFVRGGGGLILAASSRGDGSLPCGHGSELVPFELVHGTNAAGAAQGPFGAFEVERWVAPRPGAVIAGSAEFDVPISDPDRPPSCIRLTRPVGPGRVVLFLAPVFASFDRAADPALRRLIADSLEKVLAGRPRLRVEAPPWIEVVDRAAAQSRVIHLVNHARGREFRPRTPAVEEVPPARDVRIFVPLARRPREVRAVPPDVRVEWDWGAGMLRASVDKVEIHSACVIALDEPEAPP